MQRGSKRYTKEQNVGITGVMCSVYRVGRNRCVSTHRIVSWLRGNILFHSVNFTHSKSALCATSANTPKPLGLVKTRSFVRARTNLHDPSTMLTLMEAAALQNRNQLFYASAANDTCWTLLRFTANSIRNSCLYAAFKLPISYPASFTFNYQLRGRLIGKRSPRDILK